MRDLIRLFAFVNEHLFRPKQLDNLNLDDGADTAAGDAAAAAAAEDEPIGEHRREPRVSASHPNDDDDENGHLLDGDTETKVPNRRRPHSCSSSRASLTGGTPECGARLPCVASTSCAASNCSKGGGGGIGCGIGIGGSLRLARNSYRSVSFVPGNRPAEQISLCSTLTTFAPTLAPQTSHLETSTSSLRDSLAPAKQVPASSSSDCVATPPAAHRKAHLDRRRRWQRQRPGQIETANQLEATTTCLIVPGGCGGGGGGAEGDAGEDKRRDSWLERGLEAVDESKAPTAISRLTKEPAVAKTKTILDAKTTTLTTTTSLDSDESNQTITTSPSQASCIDPAESIVDATAAAAAVGEHCPACPRLNNLADQELKLKIDEKAIEDADDEDDWILLSHSDENSLRQLDCHHHHHHHHHHLQRQRQQRLDPVRQQRPASNTCKTSRGLSLLEEIRKLLTTTTAIREQLKQHQLKLKQQQQLKLKRSKMETTEIELIRASWVSARADPVGAGVLLFKGLFTKFPDYLKFFAAFSDLDLERIRDNKRLLKHAVKVIDTVTFVVDSIGVESKTDQLNEALVNLVRGHLKRKIGLNEFRNLGIVIIDFICDLNSRRGRTNDGQSKIDNSINSNSSSIDSTQEQTSLIDEELIEAQPRPPPPPPQQVAADNGSNCSNANYSSSSTSSSDPTIVKLDTNLLVAAWTKLYGSILDLVKREEEEAAALAADGGH